MKKTLLAVIMGLSLVFMSAPPINAQSQEAPVDPNTLEVTSETLDSFDPLLISGSTQGDRFSTPGGIISRVLEYAFPLAGIILFVMIVVGGFQMVLGAGEQKAMEGGRQRVTTAIVGFILLFSAYWIAQILESLFNIKIL